MSDTARVGNFAPGEPAAPPANASTAPIAPDRTPEQDALENHELYQQFMSRESESREQQTSSVADSNGASSTPDESPDAAVAPETEVGEGGESSSTATAPAEPLPDPSTPEPDAGTDTGTGADDDEPVLVWEGRSFDQDQIRQMAAVYDWANSLTPEQAQFLDLAASGDYLLIPREEAAQLEQQRGQGQGQGQGQSQGQPPGSQSADEEDEWLDPKAKAEIDRLHSELAEVRQSTQSVQEQEFQRFQGEVVNQLGEGRKSFQERHGLTDAEVDSIQQRMIGLQILPGYVAQAQHNYAAGFDNALETVYWSDPTFRQREIEKQYSTVEADSKKERARQRRASSVSSNGGSVPRVEPPATKEDRRAAMVKAVAEGMSGGQSA